jgi:hypothetical protein
MARLFRGRTIRVLKYLFALTAFLSTAAGTVLAACTTNEKNADYSGVGSGTSLSMTANINGVGDLVAITAWCYPSSTSCNFTSVRLGGQTAVMAATPASQIFAGGLGTGQGTIFYVLSASASGSQALTLNSTGAAQTQVSYVDFTPTAGCTFSHDVDAFGQSGGNSTDFNAGPVNLPSVAASVGDLLVNFAWTTEHIQTVNSPWSCPTYSGPGETQTCEFVTTVNAAGYILSAPSGSTAANMTDIHNTDAWQTLIASFSMNSGTSGASPTTYYIDNSPTGCGGSGCRDSNSGTSKTTAWAHLPGMLTWAGSHIPAAGEQFILRGGDTWHHADLGITWNWNGTSNNPIYVGVDQTWFTGASWSRPIFSCDGVACSDSISGQWAQFWVYGTYVTIDNIEFTGTFMGSSDAHDVKHIALNQAGDEVKNCYFHGWTKVAGTGNDIYGITVYTGGGGSQVANTSIHDNVIDGLDSFKAGSRTGYGIANGQSVYNNYLRYVFNGINGLMDTVHDNVVEHVDFHADSGLHCNGIYHKGPLSSTTKITMYNNVIRDGSASGCVAWYVQGDAQCPTCTTYLYNNVFYNFPNSSIPSINFAGDPGAQGGTMYQYNNTVVGNGYCTGGEADPTHGATHYSNYHCMADTGLCDTVSGTVCQDDNPGHTRYETVSSGIANGYCEPGVGGCTATLPFAPSNGSSPTVGLGANLSSLIATIGPAFGFDTTLGVGYDTVNHKVTIPARSPVARPSSGAWSAGAYQVSGSQAQAPQPPVNLQATIQ